MFETMPTATSQTVKSGKFGPYQQVKREASTRWVLGKDGAGSEVIVEAVTSHDPDSKVFRAAVTWIVKEPRTDSVFSVEKWASDHAYVSVLRDPVARYSQKALEAAHAKTLALVEEHFSVVQNVFEEAFVMGGVVEEVSA